MNENDDFVTRACELFKELPPPPPQRSATINLGVQPLAIGLVALVDDQRGVFWPRVGSIQGTIPRNGATLKIQSVDTEQILTDLYTCPADSSHFHFHYRSA